MLNINEVVFRRITISIKLFHDQIRDLQNSGQVLDDEDDGEADDAVADGEAFSHPALDVLGQLSTAGAHDKVLYKIFR